MYLQGVGFRFLQVIIKELFRYIVLERNILIFFEYYIVFKKLIKCYF